MSDEQKHTPGPWKVSRRFDIYQDLGIAVGGTYIGTTRGNTAMPDSIAAVDEANARLIATAPELLEACKAVSEFGIPDRDAGPLMVQLYEAIAKAEGKEAAI